MKFCIFASQYLTYKFLHMIIFFQGNLRIFAVETKQALSDTDIEKLCWLFGNAGLIDKNELEGWFKGPRKEMITPWSTNAVEITINMGIASLVRIEEFLPVDDSSAQFDPMLESLVQDPGQDLFTISREPEAIQNIHNIAEYNKQEGLALSDDEIEYLEDVAARIKRPLTDSEVFGFSQVNSEHCRHKIFNGTFIIDGKEMPDSLFALIKKTSKISPENIVSAYKDNVAFVLGPKVEQFAPARQDVPEYFETKSIDTVLSLKAETHNFPTTVEPFNGAATGSGGEIRDRLAGGKASIPLIGTAVYMTSYPRLDPNRSWVAKNDERKWLYQSPTDILIKASNGASDFGNKFGQPLLCGSLLTFEHEEADTNYGYDKVIMQAGGVGFAKSQDSIKDTPETGDVIVVLGGDNYRIGMGGGAVSSVATGEFDNKIELNAVQRSNPEMQKRVYNAIRAMSESDDNPIVSIHDHGAGGHLNSLSELVEETGGTIKLGELPVGDPTLSAKEIIGNESQERMGLIIKEKDLSKLKDVALRERAPIYDVGKTSGDYRFVFESEPGQQNPIDLDLAYLFGKPPKTILTDLSGKKSFLPLEYTVDKFELYLNDVLQIEAVACKDWLTNKVDRSVTGKGVVQQTAGEIQLPVNDLAVVSIDYRGEKGIATSIGHAAIPALIDPAAGSRLAIAEALTNMVWAPIHKNIEGVSLSANWMWPAKNPGENARLYSAVQAISDFACDLGISVPTGKDSMSMTQKYPDGKLVYAPGTVIISTIGEVTDVKRVVPQVMVNDQKTSLYYIDFSQDNFELGGSSLAQVLNVLGTETPEMKSAEYFKMAFNGLQELIEKDMILTGHDVSAGGTITCLLEMCFPNASGGLKISLNNLPDLDPVRLLFSEQPAVVVQVRDTERFEGLLLEKGIGFYNIGSPASGREISINGKEMSRKMQIDSLRDSWFRTSYLLERNQSKPDLAEERFKNYKTQTLKYEFPESFTGTLKDIGADPDRKDKTGIRAAIIREKGVNGDREMAYAMHLAGFDVKDVHMTDLISGRETLEDINFIVFVGGFSNSDVLGSAKGWAGAFLYNQKAKDSLASFYARKDTLSLGVCNGCQLMMELKLIHPDHNDHPRMLHNSSGKFESAFVGMDIMENNSIMLGSLSGSSLGVWVAHGEGKYEFPCEMENYNIVGNFSYKLYPGNPNGSPNGITAICSDDGRHLAMMPHLERAFLPWQWAHYPNDRKKDEVSPWLQAFANAREWVKSKV